METSGFVLRIPGSHGSLWSQRKGAVTSTLQRGRIPTLHAENGNRPAFPRAQFPHPGQRPPDSQRLHLLGTRGCWPCLGSRCPPPPTILLQSSCGNREWGRRLGGAPGAAFLCVTAHAGPLGAECSSGSLVTQSQPAEGGRQLLAAPSRTGDPQPSGASPEHPLQEGPSSRSPAPELSKASRGLKEVAKPFACGPSKTRSPPACLHAPEPHPQPPLLTTCCGWFSLWVCTADRHRVCEWQRTMGTGSLFPPRGFENPGVSGCQAWPHAPFPPDPP